MPKLQNTFWTKFDNEFYRIKDGTLLQAPSNEDNTVDTINETNTVSISSSILDQINLEFGSKFNSRDFN